MSLILIVSYSSIINILKVVSYLFSKKYFKIFNTLAAYSLSFK